MRRYRAEHVVRGLARRAVALGLAVGVVSPGAHGQTRSELARAREEFRQGLALQTAGDCAAALAKFESVGRVKMTPHVQFNIALCEERLGHLVAALGHYQLALADAEASALTDVAAHAREAAGALEGRIPRLVIRRGSGAEGASIELDGAPIGDAVVGTTVSRDPGSHLVTARLGERKVFEEAFELAEGGQHEVVVTVEREAIVTRPPAASKRAEPRVETPAPAASDRRTLAYVAGGVGVASLVTAGVFVFLRQGALDDLEARCDGNACPASAQDTIDRGRLYTGIAEGAVLLGVAGIATGTVLLLGADDAPTTGGRGRFVGISVGAPSAFAGARLTGRF